MSTESKRLTFKQWLIKQQKRSDLVGAFAKSVARDRRRWTNARTLKGILSHLSLFGTCKESLRAAERAWVEFESQTRRNTP